MKSVTWPALVLALTCCLLASPATATTIIDSNGFESPTYTPGALNGQDGWQEIHAGSSSTSAVIQDQVALTGDQALRVDRGSNSDGFFLNFGNGGSQGGPYALLSGRYVSIDWDMRYETVPATSLGLGPFFGVQVFDESGGGVRQVATLGVDSAANEFLYQQGNDGQFLALDQAAAGVWNHYRIELDFHNSVYSMFIDGDLMRTEAFVEPGGGISRWTDIDIVGIAANGDANSQANEGTAYFDNFLVRDGLRGDFNNNGILDTADYTVWRSQNGSNGFGLAADANADGQVTAADYHIWANAFGTSNAISGSSNAIPEPIAAVLALVAALSFAGKRS